MPLGSLSRIGIDISYNLVKFSLCLNLSFLLQIMDIRGAVEEASNSQALKQIQGQVIQVTFLDHISIKLGLYN